MSNQQVGTVFEKVIQEVCDSSQVDFEESGVDQKTLHDLRDHWQQKLSSVNVAHFPWDPAPQPTPQAHVLPTQTTVPSNAPRPPPQQQQQQSQQQPQAQQPPQQQHVPPPVPMPQPTQAQAPVPQPAAMAGPRIKTEPGTNGQGMPPAMTHTMASNVPLHSARERAMNNVLHKYGPAAAQTVSQLQQPGGQNYQPQMHAANGQMPQIKQEPGYPPMGPGQTDGAGDSLSDWKAEVARRREAAANGEGDRLLRDHLKQQMLGLEAGGLLQPSSGSESSGAAARRAARLAPLSQGTEEPSLTPRIPGQFDGAEDDLKEEADEDAINSDLDDPDDLVADDHDADEMDGQVMLCTYDKVQRVKNKWKCTLKDGILTTGGKEYVFHKGQGEFEW